MAKLFAWILLLFSVTAFVMGFRAQQILSDGDRVRREIAEPLPQRLAALDSADYREP